MQSAHSKILNQMWSDDLDWRKLEPGSQQQWRERMRDMESKSWEKEAKQEWERENLKILGIWDFYLFWFVIILWLIFQTGFVVYLVEFWFV